MPSRQLDLHIRDWFHVLHEAPENSLLVTLALMVTGLILGRNVQFWEMAALAYHETVLPLGWQSIRGKKGPVTGAFQKALLERLHRYRQAYRHVVVLGDAEYCNEPVITWVRQPQWDFVCHVRERCLVRTTDDPAWQPMAELVDTSDLPAGQVRHWAPVCFTQEHRLPGLTQTIHWGSGEAAPLCLSSNLPATHQPQVVYERRFWIETLFGSCKARLWTGADPFDRLRAP